MKKLNVFSGLIILTLLIGAFLLNLQGLSANQNITYTTVAIIIIILLFLITPNHKS